MSLHYPAASTTGFHTLVKPPQGGLQLLSFSRLSLNEDEEWRHFFKGEEAALVVLGGLCEVQAGDNSWPVVGERKNVFQGKATALYLPAGEKIELKALTSLEAGIFTAPAETGGEPVLVLPEEVAVRTVGKENWTRSVQDIIDARVPAKKLLVGETYNIPGGWSSYPPHKHDFYSPGEEVCLEEIYHFRMDPPQGFGFQRIYSPERDLDEAYSIENGDTVIIPCGYHPVAAAPGYTLYYLWGLAGEKREMRPREDPGHAWVNQS